MEKNEHYRHAKWIFEQFDGGDPRMSYTEQGVAFQGAQIQATLALTEEQRTANLIALIPSITGQKRLEEVVFKVLERLGLDPDLEEGNVRG